MKETNKLTKSQEKDMKAMFTIFKNNQIFKKLIKNKSIYGLTSCE